mmetsp:Transcript_25849/g.73528  ORF Transcript_25849/g.73528 Transcript_25849/m.73528 type:complete len:268 (-) Transcript_25849:764-1567(-)
MVTKGAPWRRCKRRARGVHTLERARARGRPGLHDSHDDEAERRRRRCGSPALQERRPSHAEALGLRGARHHRRPPLRLSERRSTPFCGGALRARASFVGHATPGQSRTLSRTSLSSCSNSRLNVSSFASSAGQGARSASHNFALRLSSLSWSARWSPSIPTLTAHHLSPNSSSTQSRTRHHIRLATSFRLQLQKMPYTGESWASSSSRHFCRSTSDQRPTLAMSHMWKRSSCFVPSVHCWTVNLSSATTLYASSSPLLCRKMNLFPL